MVPEVRAAVSSWRTTACMQGDAPRKPRKIFPWTSVSITWRCAAQPSPHQVEQKDAFRLGLEGTVPRGLELHISAMPIMGIGPTARILNQYIWYSRVLCNMGRWWFQLEWSPFYSTVTIAPKELTLVVITCVLWGHHWQGLLTLTMRQQ